LRTHSDDIPPLVEHFTRLACEEYNRRLKHWGADALRQLASYPFPGNVRELKNIVERAVIMQLEDEIDRIDLLPGGGEAREDDGVFAAATLTDFQERAERAYLVRKLQQHGWNVAATARAIQTPRSNLYKKIEAYHLKRED
nr:helix-turn-helix domain-containing protein [Thermoanaerobaculaceae bacterium]